MDAGHGRFEPISQDVFDKMMGRDDPDCSGVFKVGETICLRGSQFRVKSIKPKEIRLKLLPFQMQDQS